MKTKFQLFTSIFELVMGLLAVGSFILIIIEDKKHAIKWVGALLLAIGYMIMGIMGIIRYHKDKIDC